MSKQTESPYIKASVVIPVKNGGALLADVLTTVMDQQAPWPFDLLVIDSGSRDGSQDRVRNLDIRLHEIKPEDFGHGKTRNLGASLTAGEFIVFLTQDALPANREWLSRLVAAAELTTDTAGAFGKHLPYPDCSPMMAEELSLHFSGFGSEPNIVRLQDRARYDQDAGYRQFLHYFSNNNSCIRRSVWRKFPFPDVDFAEDQLWAKAIIEAGYAKAYAPDACVYHSHNFGVRESYRRAFDESRALKRLFDYDLVPGIAHLLGHWGRLTWRDRVWIKHSDLPRPVRRRWRIKSPLLNFARLAGFYMGGHQARLPDWLIHRSSRDKLLQKH